MKKVILFVVAILSFGYASAQKTSFGIKGGVNFSTVNGDIEDAKMLVGFNAGAFAEIKVSSKFSVQPEVLYSTQGTKFKLGSTTVNLEVCYVNIPVMAKYYVAPQFSLEAGPQIGFLTSAKLKSDGNSVDFKDNVESTDFGVNVGAGYDFTNNLFAALRYNIGISNMIKNSGSENAQNSVISLSLGYKFK